MKGDKEASYDFSFYFFFSSQKQCGWYTDEGSAALFSYN